MDEQNKTHASESKRQPTKHEYIGGFVLFLITLGIVYYFFLANRQSVQVTTTPVNAISATVVPTEPFDNNLGNNPIAAKYAQQYMELAEKVAPEAVVSIRLELSPIDTSGKNEQVYKKSITSAFLTVTVSPTMWNDMSDAAKKDFIAAYVNAVKNTFSGFPHVYISNGFRTVGEGEWSVLGREAKVILK